MSTVDRVREEARKSPEVLEREIEQMRGRLGRTLDQLQERLRPRAMIGNTARSMRDRSGRMMRNVGDSIAENPFPVVVGGVAMALVTVLAVVARRRFR
jgi:hypothetical protein